MQAAMAGRQAANGNPAPISGSAGPAPQMSLSGAAHPDNCHQHPPSVDSTSAELSLRHAVCSAVCLPQPARPLTHTISPLPLHASRAPARWTAVIASARLPSARLPSTRNSALSSVASTARDAARSVAVHVLPAVVGTACCSMKATRHTGRSKRRHPPAVAGRRACRRAWNTHMQGAQTPSDSRQQPPWHDRSATMYLKWSARPQVQLRTPRHPCGGGHLNAGGIGTGAITENSSLRTVTPRCPRQLGCNHKPRSQHAANLSPWRPISSSCVRVGFTAETMFNGTEIAQCAGYAHGSAPTTDALAPWPRRSLRKQCPCLNRSAKACDGNRML
jgi:hypothetical protein